jgi:Ribbon-helix-helix protein, copG family
MKPTGRKVQVVTQVAPPLKEAIDALARKERRTVSDWIRNLLEDRVVAAATGSARPQHSAGAEAA